MPDKMGLDESQPSSTPCLLGFSPDDLGELLFRWFSGVSGDMEGELRVALGPEDAAKVDLAQVRRVPGTFVDEALRQQFLDLLLTAPYAERDGWGYVYLVAQGQDESDSNMQEHVARFMVRVADWHLDEHPEEWWLPMVLPLCLNWNCARLSGSRIPPEVERLAGPRVTVAREDQAASLCAVLRKACERADQMRPVAANALIELLDRRFGPLPERLPRKLLEAPLGTLERWGIRAEAAETLHEVFH